MLNAQCLLNRLPPPLPAPRPLGPRLRLAAARLPVPRQLSVLGVVLAAPPAFVAHGLGHVQFIAVAHPVAPLAVRLAAALHLAHEPPLGCRGRAARLEAVNARLAALVGDAHGGRERGGGEGELAPPLGLELDFPQMLELELVFPRDGPLLLCPQGVAKVRVVLSKLEHKSSCEQNHPHAIFRIEIVNLCHPQQSSPNDPKST